MSERYNDDEPGLEWDEPRPRPRLSRCRRQLQSLMISPKPQAQEPIVSTAHPDLFARLSAPFTGAEIKHRPQGRRQLSYITARTVMNRLDTVLGPENWWDEYAPSESSVLCRLTIRLPDGSTLTKSDAGGYAGMADSGDDDKSGYSDAFKRAAVKFGVGRHLYGDGVPQYTSGAQASVAPAAVPVKPTKGETPPWGGGKAKGGKPTGRGPCSSGRRRKAKARATTS